MEKKISIKEQLNCYIFKYKYSFYLYDYFNNCVIELTENMYNALRCFIESETLNIEENEFLNEMILNGMIYGKRDELIGSIRMSDIAYLSFAPTYQCNFRCKYCFGEYGNRYLGKQKSFTTDSLHKMLDYFFNVLFSDAKQYRIDFVSGGEPLMGFDIIKQMIDYVETVINQTEKRVSVWLCTNGSLLTDEICEYLDHHNISIGISLDGKKNENDQNRIKCDGKGTYDEVVKRINCIHRNSKLSKKFKDIWGLSAASNSNCDFVEIVKHFKSIGINNVQIRLVRDTESYDVSKICLNYEKLKDFLLASYKEGKTEYLYMIINDNDQFGKILKYIILCKIHVKRCNAGCNKVTICPDGEIYPCDSFVGLTDFEIGIVGDRSLKNSGFQEALVTNRLTCKKCELNLLCGGDCYYNSFINTGNMLNPDPGFCNIQKCIIKLAIVLRYEMEIHDQELYQNLVKKVMLKDEYENSFG